MAAALLCGGATALRGVALTTKGARQPCGLAPTRSRRHRSATLCAATPAVPFVTSPVSTGGCMESAAAAQVLASAGGRVGRGHRLRCRDSERMRIQRRRALAHPWGLALASNPGCPLPHNLAD